MKAKSLIGLILLLISLSGMYNMAISEFDDSFLQQNFSGSVLVAKNNRLLLQKGYGMADYERNIPNTPSTTFRLGSITKQFTAMAILILEDKGLLSTNDSISKYILDYPNGEKIKIHHLLSQTSGVAEYSTPDFLEIDNRYYSPEDLIAIFKNRPLSFQPGEKFEYTDSNYVLLGYIIEKVSGKKYKDYIKEYIFNPLNMKNSGYEDNDMTFKNKAEGYKLVKPYPVKADFIDMSAPYSAGGLCSTVKDLYKWDQALYTNKLIQTKTLKKIFTSYCNVRDNCGYGYGWFVEQSTTNSIMYHTGGIDGFNTLIYRNTKKHFVIIMLSNEEKEFKSSADIIFRYFGN